MFLFLTAGALFLAPPAGPAAQPSGLPGAAEKKSESAPPLGNLGLPGSGKDAGAPGAAAIPARIVSKAAEDLGLRVRTESGGFFDLNTIDNTFYANERTWVTYKGMTLVADRMQGDLDLYEFEAAGNVELTGQVNLTGQVGLTAQEVKLTADRFIYNFKNKTGKGFRVKGLYDTLHIEHAEDEGDLPSFEQLSEHETILRNSTITGCKFSHPHYTMRAREIVVYHGDKIFLRSATLRVHGIPVFYWPFYTKSFDKGSPWVVKAGSKSKVGAWLRLGYRFRHSTEEPSFGEGDEMQLKSEGEATIFTDYFSKRGAGAGLLYEYSLNYGRHRGLVDLYFLNDGDRKVTFPSKEEELGRFRIAVDHRTQLTDDLYWTINSDYFSDPEIYDEILDLFYEFKRERAMERTAQTALTLARDQYVARIMIGIRDRIGRDRFTNYSMPSDDDRDFDEQPDKPYRRRRDRGINTSRWGQVSLKAPQITLSTAWLKMWNLPLYYHTDLNVFNNLDKGLNTVSNDDNAFVRGFDWYNSLMWRWRLGSRSTLLARLGAGGGMASREDDEFGYGDDMADNFGSDSPVFPLDLYPLKRKPGDVEGGYGILTFLDPETFLIGKEKFNLKDDVDDGFLYGDAYLRFHSRLSDAWAFNLVYKYRETTEDFLGDWYARMGNRFVRDDLYNFRLREHYLQALLTYTLARPDLRIAFYAHRNLVGRNELFPNEVLNAYAVRGSWRNRDQTVSVYSNVGLYETQVFHHSDPSTYIDSSFRWDVFGTYNPRSLRWWAQAGTSFRERLDHSLDRTLRDRRFTEFENEMVLRGLVGGRLGPKWTAQVSGDWNSRVGSFRDISFNFQRDLHDALLILSLRLKNNIYRRDINDTSASNDMDFRIAIQPKMPSAVMGKVGGSGSNIEVLQSPKKDPTVSATHFF